MRWFELKTNAEIDAMAAAGASPGVPRAAHSEHTVAVTAEGPRTLTN